MPRLGTMPQSMTKAPGNATTYGSSRVPAMTFKAGQCWSYAAPEGFENSRILIGAIASFSQDMSILCCAVTAAPERQQDGSLAPVAIPFLAFSEEAFRATVTSRDDDCLASLPDEFAAALDAWQNDPEGLACFTVPFDGRLDLLIARQMAAIVGTDAA